MIDEQIAHQKRLCNVRREESLTEGAQEAILASLQRLKAIDAVQVPEEPMWISELRSDKFPASTDASLLQHIDTLRDLLKRESARADDLQKLHENKYTLMTGNALAHMKQRAEAAEAKLAAIEKMGREPSGGMSDYLVSGVHWQLAERIFKAMFAKMMDELK
jgi:hypothetical protein